MPIIGFFLGSAFENIITNIDHWIAFVFLLIIGGKMIKESFDKKCEDCNDDITFKTMIVLAIAITFAFFKVNLILAITLIGIITFILSVIGTKIGNRFGNKFEKIAEVIGGIILILLEHLNIF